MAHRTLRWKALANVRDWVLVHEDGTATGIVLGDLTDRGTLWYLSNLLGRSEVIDAETVKYYFENPDACYMERCL